MGMNWQFNFETSSEFPCNENVGIEFHAIMLLFEINLTESDKVRVKR